MILSKSHLMLLISIGSRSSNKHGIFAANSSIVLVRELIHLFHNTILKNFGYSVKLIFTLRGWYVAVTSV